MIQQEYRVNMVPEGRPTVIHVRQYDGGSRTLSFQLYGGGLPWEVPEGATVTIDGTKADGKGFSYIATASGSTVTVTVTQQMTAAAGRAACQLTVTKGEKVLGSASLILDVEGAALPEDADMSKTDIASLETWKNQALNAKEAAETAEANAKGSATAAASSASTASTKASAASTSASNAASSASAAQTAKTAAETAQGKAETAESNAASSASTASTKASAAATSATNAANSASAAASSASTASTKASAASTSASNAASSATAAQTAKAAAETAQGKAETAESNAASSASTASTKASAASTSASNAASSATAAATSASTASTKATAASTSASNAASSATAAATSASNAASSASAAAASAAEADTKNKADKKVPSTAGNIATLDASGNLADSGKQPTAAGIGAAAASHTHGAGDITSGTLPIARGGTGGTTAEAARSNLGITTPARRVTSTWTSGNWECQQWNDGYVECWGRLSLTTAVSTASGKVYRSDYLTINYPVTFDTSLPTVSASMWPWSTSTKILWLATAFNRSDGVAYYIVSSESLPSADYNFTIYACGYTS